MHRDGEYGEDIRWHHVLDARNANCLRDNPGSRLQLNGSVDGDSDPCYSNNEDGALAGTSLWIQTDAEQQLVWHDTLHQRRAQDAYFSPVSYSARPHS